MLPPDPLPVLDAPPAAALPHPRAALAPIDGAAPASRGDGIGAAPRQPVVAFVRDSLLRGHPRAANGILVYDALEAAPSLAWTKTGYLNFGLWDPGIASGDDACEQLLAHVADRAGLDAADRVLDVGFGTGAQDVFLAGRTPATITGVNSSASQTALARTRIDAAGLAARIDLQRGDATRLEHPDASFDVVLCVEAAFHFDPREQFFREAHRVLRPGGRLVLADILAPDAPHWTDRVFWTAFDRMFFVPPANRVSTSVYEAQLAACGFHTRVERLTERVYLPFFAYCLGRYEWWAARAVATLVDRWFLWRSPCEYVVAVATK